MDATLEQINAQAQNLSPEEQQQVLNFMHSLRSPLRTVTPPGTPGHDLMHLVGLFSQEDADEMMRVIEEDCERIDTDGW